jgi:hypothetical protein
MTINQAAFVRDSDAALNKGSFSQGALGAALVTAQVMGPGPGNFAANVAPAVPTLGDLGLLVPAGVPVGTNTELPSVRQTISKLAVVFLGSANPGDVSKTVRFTLWVQRQTLLNPVDVATDAAIPAYGPPATAPFATPIRSIALSVVAGAAPTEEFADFSSTPWDVIAGDVYFMAVTFSAPLAGTITNVMVALG